MFICISCTFDINGDLQKKICWLTGSFKKTQYELQVTASYFQPLVSLSVSVKPFCQVSVCSIAATIFIISIITRFTHSLALFLFLCFILSLVKFLVIIFVELSILIQTFIAY